MKPSTLPVLHVSIAPATVNCVLKPSEAAAQDLDFWTRLDGETASSWPSNQEVNAWKRSTSPITDSRYPRASIAQALSVKQQRPVSPQQRWTIWAALWHREEQESALRTHAPWEGYRKGGDGEACVKLCYLVILPLLLPSSPSHNQIALHVVLTSNVGFSLHPCPRTTVSGGRSTTWGQFKPPKGRDSLFLNVLVSLHWLQR